MFFYVVFYVRLGDLRYEICTYRGYIQKLFGNSFYNSEYMGTVEKTVYQAVFYFQVVFLFAYNTPRIGPYNVLPSFILVRTSFMSDGNGFTSRLVFILLTRAGVIESSFSSFSKM